MPGSHFNHVVQPESIDDLSAINREEINLVHAPVVIPADAQSYLDSLDLSLDGDFRDILSRSPDPSIGCLKNLFHYKIESEDDRDPDIIASKMTQMPDSFGKSALVQVFSKTIIAYRNTLDNPDTQVLLCNLTLKYPTDRPLFHMDDNTPRRGLVFLRGDPEHGGMHYLENGAINILQRQDNGHPFKNPVGVPGQDFEVERHQMRSVPMGHMSIHKGIVYERTPALFYHPDIKLNGVYPPLYERLIPDVMYPQNPLVHSEPNNEQCPEPRLNWAIDNMDADRFKQEMSNVSPEMP